MLNGLDCDFGIGPSGLGLPAALTADEALAALDRYDIRQALVYDRGAFEAGVFDDETRLFSFCRQAPDRLLPTLHLVPSDTGEQAPPDTLIARSREAGVRAFRVAPTYHRFSCDNRTMGALLAILERRRIPLLHSNRMPLDHPWEHAPTWRDIRDIATAFPRLPIVVLFTGMLQGRSLFPLLAACPNVRADLTCFSFQYVEEAVRRFGPDRLVLASHFPCEDPGPYTAWIRYAGISEADKARIAGDTMRGLLEEAT